MKKLILAACVIGLSACAATENTTEDTVVSAAPKMINMANMSDEQAAEELYKTLLNASYLATKLSPNSVAVQFGETQFVLQPSMSEQGVDRILTNRLFAVHPQLHGSKELLLLIGSLNQKLNFAKFVIRDNGAVIQVQGAATFVDSIELEELRRFMLWTDEGLNQVGKSLPKGSEHLIKPIPVMKQDIAG
ncbi:MULTISPECIES: hypothetical protein [unclassified Shewanella]|uniref:hypothetical protein n=1 Tax=unclassified Shewanella TaxID=196818 RepID=UPI000C82A1B5|nr:MULTISPECIES: hypothetical protein [unclassified Shewanella]MDO6618459.1 hypothetical protein [Shewanella sp. 6_MG-2023]MDO6640276.1 hypothetical protein [Shewanella sp. 5_MG-2023]MDO6680275.1 hypothetical protein [Shewanella sp. 4_MG-2023]MDO6774413.1 hypothetical protein [Shewanella sp. 3_MG-2023]PMG28881.1 hypothetical protein BCU94_03285 [Shewanella sp. 10N.286.52.C2]